MRLACAKKYIIFKIPQRASALEVDASMRWAVDVPRANSDRHAHPGNLLNNQNYSLWLSYLEANSCRHKIHSFTRKFRDDRRRYNLPTLPLRCHSTSTTLLNSLFINCEQRFPNEHGQVIYSSGQHVSLSYSQS